MYLCNVLLLLLILLLLSNLVYGPTVARTNAVTLAEGWWRLLWGRSLQQAAAVRLVTAQSEDTCFIGGQVVPEGAQN